MMAHVPPVGHTFLGIFFLFLEIETGLGFLSLVGRNLIPDPLTSQVKTMFTIMHFEFYICLIIFNLVFFFSFFFSLSFCLLFSAVYLSTGTASGSASHSAPSRTQQDLNTLRIPDDIT